MIPRIVLPVGWFLFFLNLPAPSQEHLGNPLKIPSTSKCLKQKKDMSGFYYRTGIAPFSIFLTFRAAGSSLELPGTSGTGFW